MAKEMKQEKRNYKKIGVIAAAVVVVGALGVWGINALTTGMSVDRALSDVSSEAVSGADLRIAFVRMDEILAKSNVFSDLNAQRKRFGERLQKQVADEEKALEKEKAYIEKNADVLSREALQGRVAEYQNRVAKLQRLVGERANAIEKNYNDAMAEVSKDYLNPIIDGIIAKKNLSVVMNGANARINSEIANLDITGDVVGALNKRISSKGMKTPAGM